MPSLARRGTFWSAALVLALSLWSSGAPSVLYPVYAQDWGLTPVITTSVFATYPLVLLIVLLVAGGVSDVTGRRRAMLIGVGFIGVGAVLFAIAPNVGFLFAGRALQGVGTAFALGAASAALVENNVFRSPRAASSATTISTSSGLTISLVIGGALAQLLPLPRVLTFLVLIVVSIVAFVLVALTPDDRRELIRWRPAVPRIGPRTAVPVITAMLGVSVAYSVGAIFLSLGAQMARQLTGTSNLLVIGLVLAISSLTIGVTALLIGRVPPTVALVTGGAVSLIGLGTMAAAAASGSLAIFVLWCVVGGIGYSFAFTGGVGLAARTAPPEHRAGTFSLVYLIAYLLQTLTAVGAGALATSIGFAAAVDVMAPIVGVLCVGLIVLTAAGIAGRARRSGVLATAADGV